MKSLDLFCGTKSFSKIAEKHGYETTTLDILDRFNPTICCDIMDWDYKQLPTGYFDIIWASPNCKDYSKMNFICKKMDKDLTISNNLIKRVLEIIDYFKPTYWFLENPQTGKLKDQTFMEDLPYNDIDYCKYDYEYRKRTRIWNNSPWEGLPLCKKDQYCDHRIDGKHVGWNATAWPGQKRTILKWEQRISIPPKLMEEIILSCSLSAEDQSE
jgi:hypothetical protein